MVLNKDEEHIGVQYDHTEWAVVGLHDKTLEVMFEDYNDSHEVFEDDKDKCNDAQTGKLSACAIKSFHNVVTQTREEMPDNYKESTAKETDEVNKEMINYDEIFKAENDDKLPNEVNETLEVYRNHDDGLEVSKNDATCNEKNEIKVKHLNPDENADAALEDDEDQPVKPDVIKMLFKALSQRIRRNY